MTRHHHSPGFEQVVAAVIVINTGLLVWGLIGHSEFADRLETACIVFFVAEIVVRLHRAHWRVLAFLAQPWQSFDVAVIVLAFMPSLGVGITLLRVARLARLVHVGRHITHLRLFRLWRRPSEKACFAE